MGTVVVPANLSLLSNISRLMKADLSPRSKSILDCNSM